YIFPEREGGCELCEQTEGLRYINCDAFVSPFRLTSFGTFPYGAGKKVKLKLTQAQKEPR
ncbi:hypothetical protein, partial [Phascolarctobacterium succinatutens]|uniref:hypothetical protein n=1 Tax=Phascolarctobacterium succinatutens TaxID=626940 RepID=UPI003F8031A5